jgi:hypothetical protein
MELVVFIYEVAVLFFYELVVVFIIGAVLGSLSTLLAQAFNK